MRCGKNIYGLPIWSGHGTSASCCGLLTPFGLEEVDDGLVGTLLLAEYGAASPERSAGLKNERDPAVDKDAGVGDCVGFFDGNGIISVCCTSVAMG